MADARRAPAEPHPPGAPNPLPLEGCAVDWVAGEVARGADRIRLGATEHRLLRALVAARGQPIPGDALAAELWPDGPRGERALSVVVRRLRCKIEVDPARPVHLRSVRGGGYALRLAPDPEPPAAPRPAAHAPGDVLRLCDGAVDLTLGAVHRRGRTALLTAAELAVLTALRSSDVTDRQALQADALGYRRASRSRALDAVVARLRRKIEVDPSRPAHLVTVRGRGVRLVPAPPLPGWPLDGGRSFVGRVAECAAIHRRLADTPVLTVVGPAGVGKSRLAREVVDRAFGAELVYVGLGDADLVRAVADALGVSGDGGDGGDDALSDRIVDALRARGDVLLALDDADGASGSAEPIARWVQRAAGTRVLATSRAPLGAPGEATFELGPLAPDEAVRLFVDRARDVVDQWSPDDPDALRALVADLDHLPLAIELTAAWADAPGLAGVPVAHRPPNHASLDAAIGRSWARLDPALRTALIRCAAFRAAFTADDAGAVVGDLGDVGGLRRASLVQAVRGPGGEPRLELLRTVRRFVVDHADPAALADAHDRHAAHVLARARADLEASLVAERRADDPLAAIELRAVLARATDPVDQADAVIGLRRWFEAVDLAAAQRWLDALAPHARAFDPVRRGCLVALGLFVHRHRPRGQVDVAAAVAHADALRADHPRLAAGIALVLAHALLAEHRADEAHQVGAALAATPDDARAQGWGHQMLGSAAYLRGDVAGAAEPLERAAALYRTVPESTTEQLSALNALSIVYRRRGRLADARAALVEAAALAPPGPLADRIRVNRGLLAWAGHAVDEAAGLLDGALASIRRRGSTELGGALVGLALVALDRGDRRRVEALAAEAALAPLDPEHAATMHTIRGAAAWQAGDRAEGRRLLAIPAEGWPETAAERLAAVGWFTAADGDLDAARDALRAALARLEGSADVPIVAGVRGALAAVLAERGDLDEARAVLAADAPPLHPGTHRVPIDPGTHSVPIDLACRATLWLDTARAHLAPERRAGQRAALERLAPTSIDARCALSGLARR